MSEPLQLEQRGHIALLTLDNPPAHTWTPQSLRALKHRVQQLNNDRNNYGLVITGSGDKFFSAGADLKGFHHRDKARAFDFAAAFGEAFQTLSQYRGVSVAAINGYAFGGGLEVALACDIRIAAAHAQLAMPECSVGLLPCGQGSQTLAWLVGEQWAKRMILLGEQLSAEQALNLGLISEIIASGSPVEKALRLVSRVEQQSPTAVSYCKQLIMAAREQPPSSHFARERELFVKLWDDPNQHEGVSAFLEKRAAQWSKQA